MCFSNDSLGHSLGSIYCISSAFIQFVGSLIYSGMLLSRNLLNGTNNIVRLHRIKMRETPSINELIEMAQNVVMEADALDKCHESVTIEFLGRNQVVENSQASRQWREPRDRFILESNKSVGK